MFSKLLKHDSRAVLKYWWIGAVVSLCISALGGVCMQINSVEYTKYSVIIALAGVGTFFAIVGIVLLPMFTEVLLLVRYYKHFFTDEGYLTFTLPVKRTQLLDSKLLTAFIFNTASILLVAIDVFIMFSIGMPEVVFDARTWQDLFEEIGDFFNVLGGYSVAYILLGVLIIIALLLLQSLFVFACITLASSIVKKHKILATIGIYYGASIAFAILLNILTIGGFPTVLTLISQLGENSYIVAEMFMLVGVLGILTLALGGIYLFVLYLLDRRLNLE